VEALQLGELPADMGKFIESCLLGDDFEYDVF
jgi:hypothetical protein